MNTIKYKTDEVSDFTNYVFGFVFRSLGLVGKQVYGNDADVYYGNQDIQLEYKLIIKKNTSDIVWEDLIEKKITSDDITGIVGFDIINAIGFFLTDKGNKDLPSASFDEHDRLIFNKSFQYKSEIADFPIINLYILFVTTRPHRRLAVQTRPSV